MWCSFVYNSDDGNDNCDTYYSDTYSKYDHDDVYFNWNDNFFPLGVRKFQANFLKTFFCYLKS